MAFTVRRQVGAAPEHVWRLLTTFSAHGRWIPLTSITTDPGEPRVGWGFTGRSGRGPIRLVDPMVVTLWEPPNHVHLVKLGPVLLGWADIGVEPVAGGAEVTWAEEIRPPVVGALTGRVSDRLGALMVERALDAMTAELAGHDEGRA